MSGSGGTEEVAGYGYLACSKTIRPLNLTPLKRHAKTEKPRLVNRGSLVENIVRSTVQNTWFSDGLS
jgi:hypothetical protein